MSTLSPCQIDFLHFFLMDFDQGALLKGNASWCGLHVPMRLFVVQTRLEY